MDARHQWQTSCRAMATALTLFLNQNRTPVDRIAEARRKGAKDLPRLLQLHSVFGYEVADTIITFLKAFALQGIPEMRRLHDQIMKEVERGQAPLTKLERQLKVSHAAGAIKDESFAKSANSIAGRRRALEMVRRKWQNLLANIEESERKVSCFDNILQRLEIIKQEAEANRIIGGLVDFTGAAQDNFVAIGEMIESIEGCEIIPITDEDVGLVLRIEKEPAAATQAEIGGPGAAV